jgi:hypothetical protein
MNCEEFENNVNDLAREQMMEAAVRAQALVHCDECPACAQRLGDESALSFQLRALAADARSTAVPPLGTEVMATFRERRMPMTVGTNRSRSRFRALGVAATATAAAAALILVVLAFAFMRAGSPRQTAESPNSLPGDNAKVKAPQFVAGPSPVLPGKNPTIRVPGRNSKRGLSRGAALARAAAERKRKDVQATESATSVTGSYSVEVTTDFFPFGYGSAPNLGDGGQLVRVDMPRSALVAFGVPMNVNRYNETVKADVLFGADGMAHAIRFVQ